MKMCRKACSKNEENTRYWMAKYHIWRNRHLITMRLNEKSEIIKEFKTSIYDDLISVEEVFENVEL